MQGRRVCLAHHPPRDAKYAIEYGDTAFSAPFPNSCCVPSQLGSGECR